jgi:HEPN domain-containing protein
MKPPDELKRELVGQWLTKAEKDFVAAGILLESNPFVLGVVGFLAQQAAEKYLKAWLVWNQVDFPKTHNIASLLVMVSEVNQTLAAQLMPARTLSQYAVESRYPGDIPELTRDEAAAAFKLAESVRDAIHEVLGDVVR